MGNKGSCDTGSSEYLFDELPFFQPSHEWSPGMILGENSPKEMDLAKATATGSDTVLPVSHSTHLLMGEHGESQHGLHCRFGMRGVIAENHFDSTRNAIVLLGGSRRYVHCTVLCKLLLAVGFGSLSKNVGNFVYASTFVSSLPSPI